jgi:hypothetical protein
MNYHLIKRNQELNGNVGKKQKEGLHWYIQTSLSKKPVGSKSKVDDLLYIYEVGYGVWAQGTIKLVEEVVELNSINDVIKFSLNDTKYQNKSYWGQEILTKLGDKLEDNFKYFVLQIQVDQKFLDNVISLDPSKPELKSQNSWITLNNPIDFYSYTSEQLSPIISPKLRTQIQIKFNSISRDFVYDIDHFVPQSVGGPGSIEENLIPLSFSVNRWKSNRIPSGLFYFASDFNEVKSVNSKFLNKKLCSHEIFYFDNDAIKDAKLIISIINSLDLVRIKSFYKSVRSFHFPNYIL